MKLLDTLVLSFVSESCLGAQSVGREPHIGIAIIVAWLEERGDAIEVFGCYDRSTRYQRVRHACKRLIRDGLLESSLGMGAHGQIEKQFTLVTVKVLR